jgi:hypothetical protein
MIISLNFNTLTKYTKTYRPIRLLIINKNQQLIFNHKFKGLEIQNVFCRTIFYPNFHNINELQKKMCVSTVLSPHMMLLFLCYDKIS